jgi:hypothetical protein
VSGNFLPFKGKCQSLSSQAALFFFFAKGIFSHMTRANVSNVFHDLKNVKIATNFCPILATFYEFYEFWG